MISNQPSRSHCLVNDHAVYVWSKYVQCWCHFLETNVNCIQSQTKSNIFYDDCH